MARKKKPASLKKGKDENKAWIESRMAEEEKLKGDNKMLYDIPDYLDELAQNYYVFLVKELEESDILCNLDKPTLEQTADCLSKIRQADEEINKDGLMLTTIDRYGAEIIKEHPAVRTKHTYLQRYMTLANALGLDPSSRASLAAKKVEAQNNQEDELLKILRGE